MHRHAGAVATGLARLTVGNSPGTDGRLRHAHISWRAINLESAGYDVQSKDINRPSYEAPHSLSIEDSASSDKSLPAIERVVEVAAALELDLQLFDRADASTDTPVKLRDLLETGAGGSEGVVSAAAPEAGSRQASRGPMAEQLGELLSEIAPRPARPDQTAGEERPQADARLKTGAQVSADENRSLGQTAPGAVPVGQPAPASRPHPAPVAHQIVNPFVDQALSLPRRETRTLRIRIEPEEFGQIELKVTRGDDSHLSADIIADLDVAHRALVEGIDQLRYSLEEMGLEIDSLEVRLSAGAGTNSNAANDRSSMQAAPADVSSTGHDKRAEPGDDSTDVGPRRLLSFRI